MAVANGERGTVTHVDPGLGTISVQVDDRRVDVRAYYLADGDLAYGYAATVHKNQGATCDHAYLVASDALYRELAYSGLSHGRSDNRIWIVTADFDEDLEAHVTGPDDALLASDLLRTALRRSAAKQLAIDEALTLGYHLRPIRSCAPPNTGTHVARSRGGSRSRPGQKRNQFAQVPRQVPRSGGVRPKAAKSLVDGWAQRDSNPRHLPCKGSALTS